MMTSAAAGSSWLVSSAAAAAGWKRPDLVIHERSDQRQVLWIFMHRARANVRTLASACEISDCPLRDEINTIQR